MPTLVIDNVPAFLYDRIQHLAMARQRTPAAAVLEVLESALRTGAPPVVEAPLPQQPFLTEEMVAPCTIPWPEGEPIVPVKIADYIPEPHDVPDAE